MFDIDFLITDEIQCMLSNAENIRKQSEILINLVEFETTFPDLADNINDLYVSQTDERYDVSEHFLTDDDKEFVFEYAEKTENIVKTKNLLNKLCNISEGVYDYDETIASATNEISAISNIADFELSDKEKKELAQSSYRRSYKNFVFKKS